MQSVHFTPGSEEEALIRHGLKNTTLSAWFALNRNNEEAKKYYYEIPEHFVFDKKSCKWTPLQRKRSKPMIGRMYNVSASAGERFYLRLLLLHRKGCTSFEDIRTINGVVYNTFRETVEAMHLLSSDAIWQNTLTEAATYQMPYQLRQLFATICLYCNPKNPSELFEKNINELIEDYLRHYSEEISREKALSEINHIFSIQGKSNNDFGLPLPNPAIITLQNNINNS